MLIQTLGFYVVDKIGRRTLVLYGGIAMSIICYIIGALGWMPTSTAGGTALISLCTIWAFIYANSLAPIGWISLVECSTPQLRAKTAAFGAVIQACSGVLFVRDQFLLPDLYHCPGRSSADCTRSELHRTIDAQCSSCRLGPEDRTLFWEHNCRIPDTSLVPLSRD